MSVPNVNDDLPALPLYEGKAAGPTLMVAQIAHRS